MFGTQKHRKTTFPTEREPVLCRTSHCSRLKNKDAKLHGPQLRAPSCANLKTHYKFLMKALTTIPTDQLKVSAEYGTVGDKPILEHVQVPKVN